MKILAICGSLRKKSFNHYALLAAGEVLPASMTLTVANYDDIPLYNQDVQDKGFPASVEKLAKEILEADGILIASPEYNFSVSGVLKNALDWVSRLPVQPFKNKSVAVLSATGGPLGGSRNQYELRKILGALEAHVLQRPEVFIGMAQNKFNEAGQLTDEATKKVLATQMTNFEDWIKRFQPR